jgi:hypothetical protein
MEATQDRTEAAGRVKGDHSLISESLEHGERARYLAAAGVRDWQRGRRWSAEGAMEMAAMERHLQFEKWDTHEIAWRALNECWATRG